MAFEREKDGQRLIFIANMTVEPRNFNVEAEGAFKDYMSSETFKLTSGKQWQFNS